ncbi:hypothetical protein [Congregibacter litoralis]|uniref:hypothetical protein n=1 Tax=Congregibacter litoralis TaxID=393662 RepID=UPI0003228A08|nr:hypothetical protein [Congregibacter litoralis]
MERVSVLLSAIEAERFEQYCKDKGHKKFTLIARLTKEHSEKQQFAIQGHIIVKDRDRDTPGK